MFDYSMKPRWLARFFVFILEVPHSSLDTLYTFLVVSPNLSQIIMEQYFNKTNHHSSLHNIKLISRWIIYKAREFSLHSIFTIPAGDSLCSITALDRYLECQQLAISYSR